MLLNFSDVSLAGDDVNLEPEEIEFNKCLDMSKDFGLSPEEALAHCEEERLFEQCVKGLKEDHKMDHDEAFSHCLDLLGVNSEYSDKKNALSASNFTALNSILNNPEIQVNVVDAVTAGVTAWTLMTFIQALTKGAARATNPAFAFIPPALLQEFFAVDESKIYALPSDPNISLDTVRAFLKKDSNSQDTELKSNPALRKYLSLIIKVIQKQREIKEYNRTHLTA